MFPSTEGDNYICIKAEAVTGATLYAGVYPYQASEWFELDSDGLSVFQITDETEKFRIKAVKGASVNIKEFDLDVTLETE